MDEKDSKKIILNAVETTKPLWSNFGERWDNIDEVFLSRAYETGGFHLYKFVKHLQDNDIYSIDSIGSILDTYDGPRKYRRDFSGSLKSPFFQDLKAGTYGSEGEKFYRCARDFKGGFGSAYWRNLWWMLICCHDLKEKYQSSFSYYLRYKYGKFKGQRIVSDFDFINMPIEEWEEFIETYPWDDLYGVGINVFDYIIRDVEDFKFVENSFKLDLANIHFLKVTGIFKKDVEREKVVKYIKGLKLPYKLQEINKGIYSYCAETAADSYGYCRKDRPEMCEKCKVNNICKKNF